MNTRVLIFTDIHMRDVGETIVGIDPFERFERALVHATDAHPDALAILTGDLTHSGKPTEFSRFKGLIDRYLSRYVVIPGNHDRREEMVSTFPDSPRISGDFFQSYVDIGDLRLVTLDTLDGPPYEWYSHSGVLCDARLAWLKGVLEESTDKQVVIFMHHPPMKIGFPGMDGIRLRNGVEFLKLLSGYPCVAHLICGHVHKTISGSAGGISYTILKSTCHQMPMDVDVTNTSYAVDEPGSYGVVLQLSDGIVVHSVDFDLAKPAQLEMDADPE